MPKRMITFFTAFAAVSLFVTEERLDSENGFVEYSPSFLEVVTLEHSWISALWQNTSSSEETSKEIIW